MNEEIKRLRSAAMQEGPKGSPYADARYSPHELDQASLVGAAMRDEGSILISPLQAFGDRYHTSLHLLQTVWE